jgi:hypothetical protein
MQTKAKKMAKTAIFMGVCYPPISEVQRTTNVSILLKLCCRARRHWSYRSLLSALIQIPSQLNNLSNLWEFSFGLERFYLRRQQLIVREYDFTLVDIMCSI